MSVLIEAYYNGASVGRAVRDSGIQREEIYVTSKLPTEAKDYDKALEEFSCRKRWRSTIVAK